MNEWTSALHVAGWQAPLCRARLLRGHGRRWCRLSRHLFAIRQRARTEALREAGIPHADLLKRFVLMFVVRHIEVDYVRPARLDNSLVVVTEPRAVGGATLTLRQEVRGPEGPCAVLTVRLACVGPGEGKPGRIPPPWRRV